MHAYYWIHLFFYLYLLNFPLCTRVHLTPALDLRRDALEAVACPHIALIMWLRRNLAVLL